MIKRLAVILLSLLLITLPALAQDDAPSAYVIPFTLNDTAAHMIILPAETGDIFYVHELQKTLSSSGDFAHIVMTDAEWCDYADTSSITGGTAQVTLRIMRLPINNGAPESFSVVFPVEMPENKPAAQDAVPAQTGIATIESAVEDGFPVHIITIPAEDGTLLYVRELHTSYEAVDGIVRITIPDHIWYENPDEIAEGSMTVTITPYVKTAGWLQQPLDPISYDISIPLSPIELVSPEKARTEVTTAMVPMELHVRPGSTVTINGVDMSVAVDDAGQLTYNATVQPIGDNVYTINVRSPYCRSNTMQVVLYREVQEIPLDLAATTYTSTSQSKYQITATTLPGAEIDILSPHTDLDITNLNTTGEFTFYAVFDKIGDNTVSIQATCPGKKTSRVDCTIYYLPPPNEYTRKAWSLNNSSDYAELMGNIDLRAAKAQVYVAIGKIDHFISEDPQIAVVYCSEDGKSNPVLLENKSMTVWHEDMIYRFYSDVHGSYDGMPWLFTRYTYLD